MPRFGFVTTINRKRGGGKAIRNAFLALRLVHVVGRPDMTAMIGLWLLDKDDLPLYYKGWSTIMAADSKVSKKVYVPGDGRPRALRGHQLEVTGGLLNLRALHQGAARRLGASKLAISLSD